MTSGKGKIIGMENSGCRRVGEGPTVRYKHVGLWVKMSCSILVVTVVYQLNSLKLATVGHMREHPHS